MEQLYNGRILNAVSFVQHRGPNLWLILANTTAWSDEADPPDIDLGTTSVSDSLCAIQATATWVVEVESGGDITYQDQQSPPVTHYYQSYTDVASFVAAAQAAYAADTEGDIAPLVLITADIQGTSLLTAMTVGQAYRVAGFASFLTPESGYTTASFLTAAEVANWGYVELLENDPPEYPVSGSAYDYSQFYEF